MLGPAKCGGTGNRERGGRESGRPRCRIPDLERHCARAAMGQQRAYRRRCGGRLGSNAEPAVTSADRAQRQRRRADPALQRGLPAVSHILQRCPACPVCAPGRGNALGAGKRAAYGVVVSWPGDPEVLLAAPRGRRLCFALVAEVEGPARAPIGPSWEQVGFDSPGGDPAGLAAEMAAAVRRTDWHAVVAGMSEAGLVDLLAESAGTAMY